MNKVTQHALMRAKASAVSCFVTALISIGLLYSIVEIKSIWDIALFFCSFIAAAASGAALNNHVTFMLIGRCSEEADVLIQQAKESDDG